MIYGKWLPGGEGGRRGGGWCCYERHELPAGTRRKEDVCASCIAAAVRVSWQQQSRYWDAAE